MGTWFSPFRAGHAFGVNLRIQLKAFILLLLYSVGGPSIPQPIQRPRRATRGGLANGWVGSLSRFVLHGGLGPFGVSDAQAYPTVSGGLSCSPPIGGLTGSSGDRPQGIHATNFSAECRGAMVRQFFFFRGGGDGAGQPVGQH